MDSMQLFGCREAAKISRNDMDFGLSWAKFCIFYVTLGESRMLSQIHFFKTL